MNKEDYVSLEVAKLLKEKGFVEVCDAGYFIEDKDITPFHYGTCQNSGECYVAGYIGAPTLYEAAKWLRNKYDINVAVNAVIPMWFDRRPKNNDTLYMPSITHKNVDGKIEMLMLRNLNDFNYEEVCNNGILEALKLI